MDNKDIKKSPIKSFIDNINSNKNMFITKIKILKQLKANGNEVNLDTVQRVFNVNIINKKSKKEKSNNFNNFNNNSNNNKGKVKKNKANENKIGSFTMSENQDTKEESSNLAIKNTKNIAIIALVLIANFFISSISFNMTHSIDFNPLTEQLTATVYRTIQSPQTDIALKSKYDNDSNSIIYYYEIIDNLDSYSYYIKNTSLNDELRVKLLEKIASKGKEIKNLKNIDFNKLNSISLVDSYYIIDNKYKIDEKNISGKDIATMTSSIKTNNINEYNKKHSNFIIASYSTLLILEGFAVYCIYKKNKKDA